MEDIFINGISLDKYIKENYISKDKIRNKIKELEKQCETELLTTWLESQIDILEEVLNDNNIE